MTTSFHGIAQQLLQQGLLQQEALVDAIQQANQLQISLVSYLLKQKLVLPTRLAYIVSQNFGLPLLDLQTFDPQLIPLKLISEKLIRRHLLLPLIQKNKQIFIAITDPTNHLALNEIKFHTGFIPICIIVEEDKLINLIEHVLNAQEFNLIDNLTDELLDEIVTTDEDGKKSPEATSEDTPIVRYVHKILLGAINKNASDIHFEPYEKLYRIRLRIDGILYEMATPPANLINRITARIKIIAQLDISERRIPQDGRFKIITAQKRSMDFRVSTCPTIYGEKIVIRILDSKTTILDIDALGFEPQQKKTFLSYIKKPQGLILVSGPTGSGKTITLYTALQLLNTLQVNISTVEDPVEIQLPGINQVNIHPKAGLTFATALRAFLRQDPDIIMVGEMRDLETAEIGIKAAQTGHLVLSTLHTNSAAESLTRLMNIGVANYNIVSSVSLIIAQRLVRRLCEHCKQHEHIPAETLLQQGFKATELTNLKIYQAIGCDNCTDGYQGRTGIFELLEINSYNSELIMQNTTTSMINKKDGTNYLRESGLNKVRQGITSLGEINRVT